MTVDLEHPAASGRMFAPSLVVPAPSKIGALGGPAGPGANLRPIATVEEIQERVRAIAEEIAEQHPSTPITLVVVMRGGFVFAVDLIRELWDHQVDVLGMEFFQSTSYQGSKRAHEPIVSAIGRVNLPEEGPVIIVDDIVDAGRNMLAITQHLASPRRSLEICALLDRPEARIAPVHPRYVGFELLGPGFVVGYGLDYDNRYREVPHLAQWLARPPG